MQKLRNIILNIHNKVILFILALLGFASACDTKDEYGTPYAKFIVNGTVESADSGDRIENIRVVIENDTIFSDLNGNFIFQTTRFPENQTFIMNFSDIDDTINGEYHNLDTIIEFKNPEFVNGDGNWYEGETTKNFNISLEPIE